MIKIKSRPKKNYKEFDTFYNTWPEYSNLPVVLNSYTNKPEQAFYYFSKDGKEFLYLNPIQGFFIPYESELRLDEILGDKLDFSNWQLKKTSEEIGSYTKNEFLRGTSFSIYSDSFPLVFGESEPGEKDITGTWELKDLDDNVHLEFSLKPDKTSWGSERINLGFPEKTLVPFSRSLIHRKELFIVHVLSKTWKNRL